MTIFLYDKGQNSDQWLKAIKRKFKKYKIVTLEDNPNLSEVEFAMVWDLPNKIYSKLDNLKLIFSLGAGVDHILKLKKFKKIPIIRVKDPSMAARMFNHILSQILIFQLDLYNYSKNQKNKKWLDYSLGGEINEPKVNKSMTIGIIGIGFLGSYVGNNLKKMGYNIKGFKNTKNKNYNYNFPTYYKKQNLKKFLNDCDIVISLLPATPSTKNFIDKFFLKSMKQNSLFINVGRGATVNEEHLLEHLKKNREFKVSLDVFNKEPLSKKSPFWKLKNVTITPHIASLTLVNSAVDYFYKKFKNFNKKILKSDVDLKKGY